MTSFQSGRKERTQRSPACGPFAPPSDPRGNLRFARGLQSRSSTAPRISASLEATPRRKGQTALPLTARRTEALKANNSSTAPRTDGVRPPFLTVAVTGVPSANSGHCSAIPVAVAALWDLRRGTRRARHSSRHYSANSGCPDSTSSHVWPRTHLLLGKGSGDATCPPRGTHSTRSWSPGPPRVPRTS